VADVCWCPSSCEDFTLDGFVTPFEFNTFLEWFGPLKNSHKRLLQPLKAGMLSGFIPAIEANELLKNKPAGTYLIRYSKTHPGSFAVTFVYKRSKALLPFPCYDSIAFSTTI
jgi:hypothetical protein